MPAWKGRGGEREGETGREKETEGKGQRGEDALDDSVCVLEKDCCLFRV
jgi:hypothetical protein